MMPVQTLSGSNRVPGFRNDFAPQRAAFTVVELMVALAVIGLLLALLLPAVQQARSAARRTQCQNNLRQQGIAIHNHIDTWGYYPSGGWGATWLGMSDGGAGKRQPGGWIYTILPFCEQTNTFNLAPRWSDPSLNPQAVQDFAARSVQVFACPERRSAAAGAANSDLLYFGAVRLSRCSKSDYAINGGTKFFKSIEGPTSLNRNEISNFHWPDTGQLNGISFVRSEIRPADLTDGSSNVIAVGEKWTDGTNGAGNGDDQPLFAGDCLDIRRWATITPAKDGNKLGNETSFGSAHQDGAGFLFCDGSARTIPYYIDPAVFARLCARNDGTAEGDEY